MTTDTDVSAPAVEDPRDAAPRGRAWLLPAGLALTCLSLLAGLLLGQGMASDGEAVTDDVSVGFLRDMSTHHAQAVAMSEIVHRRSADPTMTTLAWDILSGQQGQIGIMSGWLELSRQAQTSSGPAMAWMGHSGPMPGMATSEQVKELQTLPVAEMETRYLQLMIQHHLGALGMARYAADNADSAQVAAFAKKMNEGQASEISYLEELLAARGGTSVAEQPAGGSADHDGH